MTDPPSDPSSDPSSGQVQDAAPGRADRSSEADRRFAERLEATGARDPREFYRTMLRDLRTVNEERYRALVATYESAVVTPIAAGTTDPLEAWLRFGVELAEATAGPGEALVVDSGGRATPLVGAPRWDQLVLHLPDTRGAQGGRGAGAVPIGLPPELSPAQRATVDLLARGKVRITAPDEPPEP